MELTRSVFVLVYYFATLKVSIFYPLFVFMNYLFFCYFYTVLLLVTVVYCNFVVYVRRTLLNTSLFIADVTFLSKEHF